MNKSWNPPTPMTCCSQSKIHKFYSCSRNRRQLICMFPYYSIEIHVSPSGSVHPRSIVTTWKWGAHDSFRWGKQLDTISLPVLELHCSIPFDLSHWLSWSSLVLPNESQQPWMAVIPPALFIRFSPFCQRNPGLRVHHLGREKTELILLARTAQWTPCSW